MEALPDITKDWSELKSGLDDVAKIRRQFRFESDCSAGEHDGHDNGESSGAFQHKGGGNSLAVAMVDSAGDEAVDTSCFNLSHWTEAPANLEVALTSENWMSTLEFRQSNGVGQKMTRLFWQSTHSHIWGS